ncbi:MAG: hypothetical protein HYY86_03335 [Candidatus Harrisonbacteria bacterium]|nr:hypothetical protein [Candidatus Harrisonbacteria bacterium]
MRLVWMRVYKINTGKMKAEVSRQQHMPPPKAITEIRAALQNGYKVTSIKNDEITLLKYHEKEDYYLALAIEGTNQEILDIQSLF